MKNELWNNDLCLISYGSIVSITWFLAYLFVDSAWDIVYLDGVVHLVCGSVVALAVLNIPKLNPSHAFLVVFLAIILWEVLECVIFSDWRFPTWIIMDTASDIILGAIGGVIIIFDRFELEAIKHQGD